jgi:regulatory protein
MAPDAFERALEALGHRERTTAELGEWLAARGFEPAEVAVAIERLVEAGALDDDRFAVRFAEDKRDLRGWGPQRIRGALAARGLDSATIDAALEGDEPAGQLQRALELLERRSEAPVDEASRGRALAYLARRGYESELAYEAVRAHERLRGD